MTNVVAQAPVVASAHSSGEGTSARLSAGASALAAIEFEGETAFGPAMKVRRFRLANGLRVLLLPDHGAPVVSYHTWFRVGSRDEKPGKTGLAHLFEHLMFNETASLPAGAFDRVLEENGAESNAATWVDWTYYHENLPASKLDLAAKLEADRMANLVLRDKQVGSEKEVVANERRYRVEDDVEGSISEMLYSNAFSEHPYHWPTIGWMKDIEGFTTSDCESFYKTYYAPNNATVVIVGDIDEQAALKTVQSHYGALVPSQLPTRALTEEPVQTSERRLSVKKPTATEKVMIGYKAPPMSARDHVVLTVLNEVLFGGRGARVYRTLIKKREIATEVRGWVATFADPGLWEMWVTARSGHSAAEVEAALAEELAKVQAHDIAQEELDRAKARLELSFLQGLETASGKAEQIGFYDTVLGDCGGAFTRLGAYRSVTIADVRAAAEKWLSASQRTVVVVLPDESAVGSEGDDEEGDDDQADDDEESGPTAGPVARKFGKAAR